MEKIYVIGIGPGSREYLLPIAQRLVQGITYLVGGPRALELFPAEEKTTHIINKDLSTTKNFIDTYWPDNKVAILVSGDVGFYSMLPWLKKHYPIEAIEVIPGISSLQVAFARLKRPWQDALLLSFHGREDNRVVAALEAGKTVGLLVNPKEGPDTLVTELRRVKKALSIYILTNLSYENERIENLTIDELENFGLMENSVVVIFSDDSE